MKYKVIYSKQYKKALKKLDKADIQAVEIVLGCLANDEILEPKYKDHKLKGEFEGFRECHIKPDLLLIYEKREKLLILKAIALGSHSALF